MVYNPGRISSIPPTLDYLFSLYSKTVVMDTNNTPVFYWFGAELGAWSSPTTVEINGVDVSSHAWAELGPNYRIEEQYSIKCKISVFSGAAANAQAFLDTKNQAFNVWQSLEIAVANDPTLGGNVRLCWFDEILYDPTAEGAGRANGTITWVVKCEARVTTLS